VRRAYLVAEILQPITPFSAVKMNHDEAQYELVNTCVLYPHSRQLMVAWASLTFSCLEVVPRARLSIAFAARLKNWAPKSRFSTAILKKKVPNRAA